MTVSHWGQGAVGLYAILLCLTGCTYGGVHEVPSSPVSVGRTFLSPLHASAIEFTYIANSGNIGNNGRISGYTIDNATGALAQIDGSPFGNQDFVGVAVAPTTRFVYATGGFGGVYGFRIASNGALTEVKGSPFPAYPQPYGLTVDPRGRFVYVTVAGDNGNVDVYGIDRKSGALTQIQSALTGQAPDAVVVDPTRPFLYDSETGDNGVSAFKIGSNGLLQFISYFGPDACPENGMAITPSGKFLYVPNACSNNVSAYSINATTGTLQALLGSPFPTGVCPWSAAIDPTGEYLYVPNECDNSVSAFKVGTRGGLTAVRGSPFPTGPNPESVAVDPTGRFTYVANYFDDTVSGYVIHATTGVLSSVAGSPFKTGIGPYSIAICRIESGVC